VRLDDGTSDAARGESVKRRFDGVPSRREHHVALLGIVDVRALDPRGQGTVAPAARGWHDLALDERQTGRREPGDHPHPIRVQDRFRPIHEGRAARLPRPELPERLEPLAHQEGTARPASKGPLNSSGP